MKVNAMIFFPTPPMRSIPNHKIAARIKMTMVGVGRSLSIAGIMGKNPTSSCMVAATAPQNQAQFSLFKKPYPTAAQIAPVVIPIHPSTA